MTNTNDTEMCIGMQQFVEALGAKYGVDLSLRQAQLWVVHTAQQTCLLISNVDGDRMALAYSYLQSEELLLVLDLVFLIDAQGGWFPVEASYTDAIWDAYVFAVEVLGEQVIEGTDGHLDLTQFAEFHATQWQTQDWVEQSRPYQPHEGGSRVRRTTDG